MMNLFLGEEVFRRGVSEYLKKHKYGNAEQDDLWASLTEQVSHNSSVLVQQNSVFFLSDDSCIISTNRWSLKADTSPLMQAASFLPGNSNPRKDMQLEDLQKIQNNQSDLKKAQH